MHESSIKNQKKRKQTAININKRPKARAGISLFGFPKTIEGFLQKAAVMTLEACGNVLPVEINFILVSDTEIRKLNRKYRRVNRITDIISFLNSPDPFQGDIYISRQRSRRQAKEQEHSWEKELAYLVIHGVLHLFGYTDYAPKERFRMFSLQDKIFMEIGDGLN